MDLILKSELNDFLEILTGRRLTKNIDLFSVCRNSTIQKYEIDTIIDVGANRGQWAIPLVKKFPSVKFHSFEPLPSVFEDLNLISQDYKNWDVYNVGVGSKNEVTKINSASNSGLSSSFLESTNHSIVHPGIHFEKSKTGIEIVPLDDFINYGSRNFLKIDTGGYENTVLDGMSKTLSQISVIEIESSFTPMYEGEASHHRVISRLEDEGFVPISFGNVHHDSSGRVWQLDTLLISEEILE
jgi:FkbM family methyltransferase